MGSLVMTVAWPSGTCCLCRSCAWCQREEGCPEAPRHSAGDGSVRLQHQSCYEVSHHQSPAKWSQHKPCSPFLQKMPCLTSSQRNAI